MICVRIEADTRPPINPRLFDIQPNHPLAEEFCPVCEELLPGAPVVLVVVGIYPDDRKEYGWTNGATVPVHAECTGYTLAEIEQLKEDAQ